MIDPEAAYRRANAHWQGCSQCANAGGEAADPEDLCPTGLQLTRQWIRAEETFARDEFVEAEYQRYFDLLVADGWI